jgi:tungstate transport system substrate-binding protein
VEVTAVEDEKTVRFEVKDSGACARERLVPRRGTTMRGSRFRLRLRVRGRWDEESEPGCAEVMMSSSSRMSRRSFLERTSVAIAVTPVAIAAGSASGDEGTSPARSRARAVRVASVPTAVEGGLLPDLADAFRKETGMSVAIQKDEEPYAIAERGGADLVISHFGHKRTEAFVTRGLGLWPRTVFSNQLALFGPRADPAGVRGAASLVHAFGLIARARAPYVLNETHGIRYLTDLLWCAAGRPAKEGWFFDDGVSKGGAIALAAERGGYVFWGLTPFVRNEKAAPHGLEPLLTGDPMLQRLMVAVVVNPKRVAGVDLAGATRFQEYLLLPATQARILEVRYPGVEHAVWAPAGRHNPGSALPRAVDASAPVPGAGRESRGG